MYTWKINMKNGDFHLIQNNIANSGEFAKALLGENSQAIMVSHLKLARNKKYCDPISNAECEVNWIAIISTDVSSFEWMGN